LADRQLERKLSRGVLRGLWVEQHVFAPERSHPARCTRQFGQLHADDPPRARGLFALTLAVPGQRNEVVAQTPDRLVGDSGRGQQ
jgi:hypothetical protein